MPPATPSSIRETFLDIVQEGLSAGYLEVTFGKGETSQDPLEAAIMDIAGQVEEAKELYSRVKRGS